MRASRVATLAVALSAMSTPIDAQVTPDSARRPVSRDTVTVQGSIYNRPFMASVGRTSIGGYAEGNTNYQKVDGVSEGFSMEFRRFNIFLFAPVGPRLRFFSELEFEHGTEEIALETAQLDWQIAPTVALRAGIILPPIGAFNQNHDSPRWEFVDRPLVSTELIPATLSEMGFGAYGRFGRASSVAFTWDAYVTNGLGDGVINNGIGRTSLAAGKSDEQFAEDNNGSPAISGRVAARHRRFGEVGLSYYGAVYNRTHEDGVMVDKARRVHLSALDLSSALGPVTIRGEVAVAAVNVPVGLTELFGARQQGAHVDLIWPMLRRPWLGQPEVVLNAALRLESVDWNVGRFAATGQRIGDDVSALVAGLSLRPTPSTVFKLNYRRQRTTDLLGNAPSRMGGVQVGFATYF